METSFHNLDKRRRFGDACLLQNSDAVLKSLQRNNYRKRKRKNERMKTKGQSKKAKESLREGKLGRGECVEDKSEEAKKGERSPKSSLVNHGP